MKTETQMKTLKTQNLPKLRDYQKQVISDLNAQIQAGHQRNLIVAATGSGKTIVAAEIVYNAFLKGQRVLFVVHRDVLIQQTLEKFSKFGINCGVIAGGRQEERQHRIQIASVQTLAYREIDEWFRPNLVICDECHLTSFTSVMLKRFPKLKDCTNIPANNCIYIGLTATPFRLDKKEELGDIFTGLVMAPFPEQLIEWGFLTRPVYYSNGELDLSEVGEENGDFAIKDLEVKCNVPEAIAAAVKEWQRLAAGRATIAFAVSIAHARAIASSFRDAGVSAAHVDGSMSPKERNIYYEKLSKGQISVLASCESLAEGYDDPKVSAVLLCRPTKSRAKYFQQVGRGLRISPNKTDCLVLDQAGLVKRFGFIEDFREVSLNESGETESGEIPMKTCPLELGGCGALTWIATPRCRQCGYDFVPREKLTPIQALERMIRDEDRQKFYFYRQKLNEAFAKGFSPAWAAERWREEYESSAYPPEDWARGAIFGDNPTPASEAKYRKYLNIIAGKNHKPKQWVVKYMKSEFGADWSETESVAS
ncbi:DEAD/DEAH box helicase [Aerosakkonema sp. BLCC-F2]|uniref:DEAD/DEAH box helicase n=1 Tax=Aerosakkonema sp. BLCC-F183 TaxID=3342834 RepID=UPI0035B9800A